jgi:hypothetical protein
VLGVVLTASIRQVFLRSTLNHSPALAVERSTKSNVFTKALRGRLSGWRTPSLPIDKRSTADARAVVLAFSGRQLRIVAGRVFTRNWPSTSNSAGKMPSCLSEIMVMEIWHGRHMPVPVLFIGEGGAVLGAVMNPVGFERTAG